MKPEFLPDFELESTQMSEEGGIATVVDAVTVDGQVDLVVLLGDACTSG